MAQTLYDVDESEEVARILFSPTMVQEGRISRNAFFLEQLRSGNGRNIYPYGALYTRLPHEKM